MHKSLIAGAGLAIVSTFPIAVAAAEDPTSANGASLSSQIEALKQQLDNQRTVSEKLEQRLNELESAAAAQPAVQAKAETPSAIDAGYKDGFYIQDASGNNSLHFNGLLQPRFNYFTTHGTKAFGATDSSSDNFDVFLGRLYFSGNLIDPSVTYWFTLQGTTTGNGSGINLLDAVIAKSFSPYFHLEMGKYWSAYTYEYYDDIGQYLLPDLSAAEWAFSLGRQTGARVSGKVGNLTYRFSASNSIPGSDVGNTENVHTQLATVLNLEYDILAPYGYHETDPSGHADTPQLSLWASAMSNPVQYSSTFQNDISRDKTRGATTSLNFRSGYFSFQGSGYYKNNDARGGTAAHESFNSWGWQEQMGYYLIPKKLELAERVDGITWGLGQIPASGGSENQWYAGPSNFSYHHLNEYTAGLNYYFYRHKLKAQLQYSYLEGSGFNDQDFHANRLILQTQLAF